MNLIDYGRILLRRGWIILLLALLAAGSAYLLTSRQTPQYRAAQVILIQPARTDNGLTLAIIQLMNSYQVYLKSTQQAQVVIDTLKLDLLADDLLSKVDIVSNRDNLTLEIDVTLPDQQMASDVARTWGNLLVQYRVQENQKVQQTDRVFASLPDKASGGLYSPKPLISAAAGAILGLILGGVIIFVLEYLESSIVRRREDIERALDLPVLATIPEMEHRLMPNAKLITLSDPRSAAAEAFRTLRTNLMFTGVEHALDTLLVTSAAQSDDKSLVLANLAVTFAQSDNKTIIVDSDLRRPTQHEIWGIPNERGLTTMMLDPAAMSSPPLVQTEVPNLMVLPSGVLPPVPADVLSSQRMLDVIGVLKARAHYILFEAPPVLAATDAALLGAKLDGVVLVVRVGATRRDQAARARQALELVHVRVLGAVMTNAPRESVGSY